MTTKIQRTLTIPETLANERLDQALTKLIPEYSRTQIQTWIQEGTVKVNEKIVTKSKMKVQGGEIILLEATLKPQPLWEAQAIPLPIVYEDDELIVINKPVGMVVHPGAGNINNTLLNALLHHAPQLKNLPRAGIIHRIDKNTSGLLVIAKTPIALKDLSMQLKKRTLQREYQAIVVGTLISGGTIGAPIGRHPLQRKQMAVVETGKPAITHYRILEKYRAHTRIKVRLETGRTHQIRIHMAHIHHPIVGDITYGGRLQIAKGLSPELIAALRQCKRQALHAYALGFTHPLSKKPMRFEIDLPDDMRQLITALRNNLERIP